MQTTSPLNIKYPLLIYLLSLSQLVSAQIQQLSISRVEQMPDSPSPYLMRDWEEVTIGYDAFIYDISKTGDYLPLIFINDSGVNYPENKNFGLDTYVGTFSTNGGEAINVLPSIIGASLVGIDKSDQNGMNWVLMSQDFFNKRPEENVYLNNYNGNSGTDWWYDIMPNIYFYQLNDLYPEIGDADFQFTSIADQWLKSVQTMGASDTPWELPNMNYRAWNLSTMTPLSEGVKEPEAAGGIGWLLYNAYIKTGNTNYLKGAEWSMEFLNILTTNPSYELQLPYGVYTAARMNAQIGTSYDIEKLLNWTFDRGELRGWGSIVGQWNGLDVSGLIGEANDQGNDYAFLMNGFQHAGALVPMVRYDKRFARSIGKWILNLANASRLFYPGFLPGEQQDASSWSDDHDPNGYIGYEGLREKVNEMPGPFSTGDALGNGWANTNLALYGSSSVGIFGGLIKTTNVEKILQLDLLKTDYYDADAYPTFLYYNPYPGDQIITIDVGSMQVDLYDAITEAFLLQNVSGNVDFTIPGNQAVELVLAPAEGTMSFDLNKLLIDGVVVDYMQTAQSYNHTPRIKGLATDDQLLEIGSATTIYATATDKENEALTYAWKINEEIQATTDPSFTWTAPETVGTYQIAVTVSDEQLNESSSSLQIEVVDHINSPPIVISVFPDKNNIDPHDEVTVTCIAEDADNDELSYSWTSSEGTISGSGNSITWTSPSNEGVFEIKVAVDDGNGAVVEKALNLLVRDFSNAKTGKLIAYYPFSGNANDASGHQLDGQVFGATLAEDLQDASDNAYYFDGVNDYIKVNNSDILNLTEAITVSCWIRPENLSSGKEAFILSHGSWQNRWKLSINSGKARWTLNTITGINDVDSNIELTSDENYHLAATYDGEYALLYINGKLDGYAELSGEIKPTTFDFLIGRMLLDDDNMYNYKGLIDEVLVYDYALSPDEVNSILENPIITGKSSTDYNGFIKIFPNPTTGKVSIKLEGDQHIELVNIYNVSGQKMNLDLVKYENAGQMYFLDLSNYPNGIYFIHFEGLNNEITSFKFIKDDD